MQQPGRKFAGGNGGYRYGFNGQEKSDEIFEGSTTAEYWEYDSRIGRRWNRDQVYKHSPYSTYAGNPIWFSDPLGLDTVTNWTKATNGDVWGHEEGKSTFYYTLNGKKWESSGSVSEMEEAVVVHATRNKATNSSNPKFNGGGEARAIAIELIDKNISSTERNINGIKPSDRVGSLNLHVERLQEKQVGLLLAKKGLESLSTAIDVWDVGVGLHAYATNGNDADIFSSIPGIGSFFSASNDLIMENEQMVVNFSLQQGYSHFYQLLTKSTIGRRSGLTGVFVSGDVLKSVIKQGFLDLNMSQIGKGGGPLDSYGNKYDYFLVFPEKRDSKITQFIPLKVE